MACGALGDGDTENIAPPRLVERRDEFGALALELNALGERLAERERMRHDDRLRTVGQLASGVAHELGTPLSVVAVRARLIASGEATGDEAVSNANAILDQSERMTRLVRQLLDYSRRNGNGTTATVDLRHSMLQATEMLEPLARSRAFRSSPRATRATSRCAADAGQLQQVLTNLVMNAIQAMPTGGRVEVRCGRDRAAAGGRSGRPVLGTRHRRRARRVARRPAPRLRSVLHHQGRRRRHGPRPCGRAGNRRRARRLDHRAEPTDARRGLHGLPPAGRGGGAPRLMKSGRVLVVDDDKSLCETLAAALGKRGFDVEWRTDPAAAYELAVRDGFEAVVTDLRMGQASGLDLCARIVGELPDLPVVLITAFGTLDTAIAAIRAGAYDFITKPIEIEAPWPSRSSAPVERRRLRKEVHELRRAVGRMGGRFGKMLGSSDAMRPVYDVSSASPTRPRRSS
jgi:CheY-like chemotaxis protein